MTKKSSVNTPFSLLNKRFVRSLGADLLESQQSTQSLWMQLTPLGVSILTLLFAGHLETALNLPQEFFGVLGIVGIVLFVRNWLSRKELVRVLAGISKKKEWKEEYSQIYKLAWMGLVIGAAVMYIAFQMGMTLGQSVLILTLIYIVPTGIGAYRFEKLKKKVLKK